MRTTVIHSANGSYERCGKCSNVVSIVVEFEYCSRIVTISRNHLL